MEKYEAAFFNKSRLALRRVSGVRGSAAVIRYPIGTSGQVVVLAAEVLTHVLGHRQRRWYSKEAGGQLFARFDEKVILVAEATGPRPTDRRTRRSFAPDRRAKKMEIGEHHARGLHFVGDWHTHPDDRPVPSGTDLSIIAECFMRATHLLKGFLMLFVGRFDPPTGFSFSIHDGRRNHVLTAES